MHKGTNKIYTWPFYGVIAFLKDISYSFESCWKRSFLSIVGCQLPWNVWLSTDLVPLCNNFTQYDLWRNLYGRYITISPKEIQDEMGCPPHCEAVSYTTHKNGLTNELDMNQVWRVTTLPSNGIYYSVLVKSLTGL